jgi:hypothetical protein
MSEIEIKSIDFSQKVIPINDIKLVKEFNKLVEEGERESISREVARMKKISKKLFCYRKHPKYRELLFSVCSIIPQNTLRKRFREEGKYFYYKRFIKVLTYKLLEKFDSKEGKLYKLEVLGYINSTALRGVDIFFYNNNKLVRFNYSYNDFYKTLDIFEVKKSYKEECEDNDFTFSLDKVNRVLHLK